MAKIDFCIGCGCWIAANTGTMRQGPDGEAEIICNECLVIEKGNKVAISHDCRNGTLDLDDDE